MIGWRKSSWLPAVIALALLAGVWRGQSAVIQSRQIQNLFGQTVQLVGQVSDDPVYTAKSYTEFSMKSQLPGEVKVRTRYLRLQRGYTVAVEGKLEKVLGSKTAQIGFASKAEVVSSSQSWLEINRQRFFAGMRTALPEPLSSFGAGLLMGTRSLIPRDLQTLLSLVGLSHLVAVSGYNLTILVDGVRLSRGSAFMRLVLPLWLIGVFCVVTGFSASITRAAVVSGLSLLAVYYGRRFKPMVLLGISAVVTAAWRPSYLWSDLGWQLSFLAFFGILVVAPTLESMWSRRSVLADLGMESLSAQLMTAPLIMAVFGTVSAIAPITNLLVLPLIPLAMLLSVIAGIGGMFAPHYAGLIGLPANWLLQAIIGFVERAGQISWASYQISSTPLAAATAYGLIGLLVLLLKHRYNTSSQQAGETDVRTLQVEHNQA